MTRETANRPTSRRSSGDADAVASRRLRAAEEPLDVRLVRRDPFVELEVRNPLHGTRYRVFFPSYPERDAALCTCTDFARRGLGTCKHVEAGWEWLSGPSAPPRAAATSPIEPTPLWARLRRDAAALARRDVRDIRELERLGRAMIEDPGPREGTVEAGTEEEEVGRRAPERGRPTTTSRARP